MNNPNFKVIIAGTRDFTDYELLCKKCDTILSSKKMDYNIIIVSGTARGADRLGERYARERGYRIERYPADWDRDGNSAGPIRNAKMADNAHALIAFWDGRSRGTKNMIDTAKAKGLMVRTIITNTTILQKSQESKIQHPSGTMPELDLFGKKGEVNNSGQQPDSETTNNKNKVEDMEEKKNVASEDKKYQPGDVIEIYDGDKSKYGYGDTAFFMVDEETGVNSWEVGIEGKRIHICVAEDDCHLPAQDMLDKYLPQYRVDEIVNILKAGAANEGFTPDQEETIKGYFDAYSTDNGRERAAGYVLSRLDSTIDNSQKQSAGILDAINEFKHLGDPKVKRLREQTSQYAIEHITKKGLHTGYAWVRDAFNDYYDAIKAPGAKISAESDIAHREILAQKVAIDCVHKLSNEQLQQLDKVLKEIVSENNISNGLHR